MKQLGIAQKRMDHINLPSDLNRIPLKIAIKNKGFSNLTANQGKIFIMIYSTIILWNILDDKDRKILGNFVGAYNILVARFITKDDLKEMQDKLKNMAHFIEKTYRPEFITSNIYLILHISNYYYNYNPIYSFGLFPYEKLNGYIGKTCVILLISFKNKYKKIYYHCPGSYSNNNRQIEPELIRIILKDTLIDYHLTCKWLSDLLEESFRLIMPKKAIGSLAFMAEREELQYFLFMRHNIFIFSKIYGTEKLPGQMLNPSYFKVIMPLELCKFLCEWYSVLYEKEKDEILEFMDLIINQHIRLQIGNEIFGSIISSQQGKNATILAKGKAVSDESVNIYLD